MTDTMLSGITRPKVSEPMQISANLTESFTNILSDDPLEMMNMDHRPLDMEQYMDDCIEAGFGFAGSSPSLSVSSVRGHDSVTRTSSNEETGSTTASKYTSPASLGSTTSVESGEKELVLSTVSAVTCEDFPYEDVLSLENALEQAVGDSMEKVSSFPAPDVPTTRPLKTRNQDKPYNLPRTTTHKMADGNVSNTSTTATSAIPPISNILPKVSHRVVISPTTTLILSDDVMRKKHRPVSVTSPTTTKSISSAPNLAETEKIEVQSRMTLKSPGACASYGLTKVTSEQAISSTSVAVPSYSVVIVSHGALTGSASRQMNTGNQIDTNANNIKRRSISISSQSADAGAVEASTKMPKMPSSPSETNFVTRGSTPSLEQVFSFEKPSGMPSSSSTVDEISQPCSPDHNQKAAIHVTQKQPLPPEGYKITRYPLKSAKKSSEDDQEEGKHSDQVQTLQFQLRRARMEIAQRTRDLEDWKSTAKQTFEAARKIRAQMELERSRADRAESRISQLISHFRTKALAKANTMAGKSSAGDKATSNTSPRPRDHSPATSSHEANIKTEKRRTLSDPPIILSRKRRRTVTGVDEAAKDLASWLVSAQYNTSEKARRSLTPPVSLSVSETLFGRDKDDLVHAPQINSGVRLALRAKVCSARAETLNTAYEMIKQTKLLVADLPTIPESVSGDSMISNLLDDRMTKRNRWRSVDSIPSSSDSMGTPSDGGAEISLQSAQSDPSLENSRMNNIKY